MSKGNAIVALDAGKDMGTAVSVSRPRESGGEGFAQSFLRQFSGMMGLAYDDFVKQMALMPERAPNFTARRAQVSRLMRSSLYASSRGAAGRKIKRAIRIRRQIYGYHSSAAVHLELEHFHREKRSREMALAAWRRFQEGIANGTHINLELAESLKRLGEISRGAQDVEIMFDAGSVDPAKDEDDAS